jgi:sulfide dehydrogenase [flavocytochrome c] flavoprotein subunit
VYKLAADKSKIESVSGGVSAADASASMRQREVLYAHSWFSNITADMFT